MTDVDEEVDEIYQIGEIREDDLKSEKSETYERYQIENSESLKNIYSQKQREWWSCWYWCWAGDKCGGKQKN